MNTTKKKTLEDHLFFIGIFASVLGGAVFAGYLYLQSTDTVPFFCLWDRFLGLYCPGCGGTRAVLALLHGDILKSLWYHPLVLYTAIIFGAFMLSQAFARLTKFRFGSGVRFHNWFLYGALGILVFHFIEKNLLRLVWHITL
jgi:hypothetical protein